MIVGNDDNVRECMYHRAYKTATALASRTSAVRENRHNNLQVYVRLLPISTQIIIILHAQSRLAQELNIKSKEGAGKCKKCKARLPSAQE